MNHAALISEALYPGGSQQVRFNYSLRQLPSPGVSQLSLTIDGQTLTGTGQTQQFAWTGTNSSVQGTVNYTGGSLVFANQQGLWAPFHFLQRATWGQGPTPTLDWPLEVAGEPVKLSDGTKVVIRYELESGTQMFKKDSLGQRCPPVGAR